MNKRNKTSKVSSNQKKLDKKNSNYKLMRIR